MEEKEIVEALDSVRLSIERHINSKEYNEALTVLRSKRLIFEKYGMKVGVAWCDLTIGIVHQRLGRYREALEFSQSAREVYEKHGMEVEIVRCNIRIAIVNQMLGRYVEALELYRSARGVFEKHGMEVEVAECDQNMGVLHGIFGQHDQALTFFRSAKGLYEKHGMELQVAWCDIGMASELENLGRYSEALDLSQSVREVCEKHRWQVEVAWCDLNIANVHLRVGHYNEALELYRSVRGSCESYGMEREVSVCNSGIANVLRKLGQYDEAISLYQQVNENFGFLPNLKWKSLAGKGLVHREKGEIEQAGDSYREAIEVIEGIRKALSQEVFQTPFLASVYSVYFEMVDCCLTKRDFGRALEYVERLKSRNLAEMLSHRDLMPRNVTEEEKQEYQRFRFQLRALTHNLSKEQNRERSLVLKSELEMCEQQYEKVVGRLREKDPDFDPDQVEMISYDGVKGLVVDRETALIEFFPMPNKTIVFVVRRDGESAMKILETKEYSLKDLNAHIENLIKLYGAYRRSIRNEKARKEWEEYLEGVLKQLYRKIFIKIKTYLKGIIKIVMIPYGGFHLLPLHAMFAEEDGKRRYVIDDYLVTYAPSAKILKHCRDRERVKKNRVVIAFANPEGSPPLDFSSYEVQMIQRLFKETELILKATREEIIQYGKNANIFHFAGHAHLRALFLHSENDRKTMEEYHLDDLFVSLDLPHCYLAVLSGCETGMVTELREIDEYLGLTSGFLHAGTATVVSSLWTVSDLSTSLLMQKMYELLKKGKGKSESLREAQLWLKDTGKRQEQIEILNSFREGLPDIQRFAPGPIKQVGLEELLPLDLNRPYYWAGFICSGAE